MKLKQGSSPRVMRHNIQRLMQQGKSRFEAMAIARQHRRESERKEAHNARKSTTAEPSLIEAIAQKLHALFPEESVDKLIKAIEERLRD